MKELTVEATLKQIRLVTEFISAQLHELDCPLRTQIKINVAVDEIFSNIVHYAYATGSGSATVRVAVEESPRRIAITFVDRGVPYNPLAEERPDTTHLPKMERPIGGLGLFMVKKTMDDVTYDYRDGQNILTIRKNI